MAVRDNSKFDKFKWIDFIRDTVLPDPKINKSRVYFDHVFDLDIPVTGETQSPITKFVRQESNYNFFIKDYEDGVKSIEDWDERLLPNFYIFLSQLAEQDNRITNPAFRDFITLDRKLQVDQIVINEAGNERLKTRYFDSYGRYLLKNSIDLRNEINPLLDKFSNQKNIIFPAAKINFLTSLEKKSIQFPMNIHISLNTDVNTRFAQALQESNLTSTLISDVIRTIEQPGDPNNTLRQQQMDFTTLLPDTNDFQKDSYRVWDIESWIRDISMDNFGQRGLSLKQISLGSFDDQETAIATINTDEYRLFRLLMTFILNMKIKGIIEDKFRSFRKVLDGTKAYSEVVFYRIQKLDRNGREMQNYWIPNSNNLNVIDFHDTQVKYNKQYQYKIFSYKMVLGNKYFYSIDKLPIPAGSGASVTYNVGESEICVINRPSIKLIEVPYYDTSLIRVIDTPPIHPQVSFIPYRSVPNRIQISLSSGVGKMKAVPIILKDSDNAIINSIREKQNIPPGLDNSEVVLEYSNDDAVSFFEIFRIDNKPSSYEDFRDRERVVLSPIGDPDTTSVSFDDFLLPNKKYYYVFRGIDVHEQVSNPTEIFEVELVESDGGVLPQIRTINLNRNVRLPGKNAKRFIEIRPSFRQTELNEEGQDPETFTKGDIQLGTRDIKVWSNETARKRFKIRLVSKKTGKKIDFNLECTYKLKNQ